MLAKRTVALLAALVLALSAPVAAGETSLEARIQAVTGITRVVDLSLQARAAGRVVQIQTEWGHCCLSYGESEIIAWNSGYEDPIGQLILGWLGSEPHRATMFSARYDRIGCATSYLAPRTYGVCIFAESAITDPPPGPEPAPAPPPEPTPPVLGLPDTAMLRPI